MTAQEIRAPYGLLNRVSTSCLGEPNITMIKKASPQPGISSTWLVQGYPVIARRLKRRARSIAPKARRRKRWTVSKS